MARMARVVVPGYPHHVTQRGNRRQKTFFCDDDYRTWSSAYAHLAAQDDRLVRVKPMLDRMNDWATYLSAECDEDTEVIKLHTRTGRPLGSTDFVEHLEAVTGKVLAPRRPGRKEKS
jgi:putative transposase